MACERGLDELRVVANQADLDVRRQRLLDLGHPRLDRVGQRDGVDAALLADGDGQGRAVPSSIETDVGSSPVSTTRPMSRMRIGELPRVATTRSLKASGLRRRPTVRTESSRAALLEAAARQLEVLRAQRRGDVGRRQAVSVQPIGIDLDLDLAAPRAEEQHLADAVDRLEPLLDVLLEERRQLDDRHRRRDREHQDRERVGILLLHDRRVGGLRQVADDRIDLGAHFLRGDVGVLRQVERDGDARAALGRGRAQLVDAGDGVDRGLDAVGDLGLDVLGRRAGVGGRDRDDRRLDARVAIDAEREERDAADDGDGGDEHRGEDRAVDADFSELLHGAPA